MLREVRLHGTLAIDSGIDSIQMDVNHAAMLFKGLEHHIPDFRKIVSTHKKLMVIGSDGSAETTKPSTDLMKPFGDCKTIHVMPATEGDISEGIAAAIGAYLGASAATAAIVGYAVIVVAYVAVMYGISKLSQSLAPKPSTAQSDASFIFSGPVNSANQGGAVPIIYGTCLVGSTVIATNYQTLDIPIGSTANTYSNTFYTPYALP